MQRLTQSEMHITATYLNAATGNMTFRQQRHARRKVIRALKRAPPELRVERFGEMKTWLDQYNTMMEKLAAQRRRPAPRSSPVRFYDKKLRHIP